MDTGEEMPRRQVKKSRSKYVLVYWPGCNLHPDDVAHVMLLTEKESTQLTDS